MAKAKLEWGEKSKAIREALSTHPYLKNSELVEHLKLRGIECTAQDVSSQKARLKMQASGHASLSVDQLLKIKGIIADAGGLKAVQQRLDEVDRIAQQAGGLIKLKQGMQILPEIANS